MLQFTNTDLDAALAPGQERTIRPLLQVDWLQNGSFVSAASQLTSDNLINVQVVDDVDGALPDEVNGRPTASSTTLRATLHGYVGDVPLWQLFSVWNRESPYHGVQLDGAAVQYSIFTATSGGSTETRRFTGWIDSVQVNRVQGTVEIVAMNNLHLLGHTVTLPRWARQTDVYSGLAHITGWDIPTEDRMENAPLTAAYLFQNVLRQCNAVPGPDMRSNGIWFSSGYGGLIPERGGLGDVDAGGAMMSQGISSYGFPQNWGFPNYNRDVLSFAELGFPSPYHESLISSGSSSDIFDTYSQSAATVELNPVSGQPRYLNGGLWVRIPSGDSGSFVDQTIFLDPWRSDAEGFLAKVRLVVGASNTTLTIRNTNAGDLRTLTVATPTTKNVLIYVSWELDFANPANMKIWYNNVLQTGSLSGTLATYPTLNAAWLNATTYRNKVRVWCRHSGFLNAEIWLSSTAEASDRVLSWSNGPYTRKDFAFVNGGIPGAQVIMSDLATYEGWAEGWGSMPRVTHIPVREQVDAWELLKEMAAAFHMTMWIDAYGGLRVIPQEVMAILEQRLLDPRKELDGDSMQGVSLSSNFDAVRDRIVYSAKTARAVSSIVYQASDPLQYYANAGQTRTFRVPLPPEAIGVPSYKYAITQRYFDETQDRWLPLGGYKATQANGDAGTAGSRWPVVAELTNVGESQQYFDFRIINSHSQKTYLADASVTSPGSGGITTPAFKVPGLGKLVDEVLTYSQGSGNRLLQIPLTEWHSAPWTFESTIAALLTRASAVVPRAEDLTVPGDPRREVYDLLNLRDPDGGLAVAIAQIIGRTDTWSSGDGYSQTLTVRLVFSPDSWLLDIDGFSELGETTYLG